MAILGPVLSLTTSPFLSPERESQRAREPESQRARKKSKASSFAPSKIMKFSTAAVAAFAAGAAAAPKKEVRQSAGACDAPVNLDASTNVFQKYTLHPNAFYRSEVQAAAQQITEASLKEQALKVADVGSFLWL